jgi:hypothetical protein
MNDHGVASHFYVGGGSAGAVGACDLDLNLNDDVVDDVLLTASELVANATEHATGPYELWPLSDGSEYVLECHDSSPDLPPTPGQPSPGRRDRP